MADTGELEEEIEIPPRLSMEAQNQTEPEEESVPRYVLSEFTFLPLTQKVHGRWIGF